MNSTHVMCIKIEPMWVHQKKWVSGVATPKMPIVLIVPYYAKVYSNTIKMAPSNVYSKQKLFFKKCWVATQKDPRYPVT